MGGGSTNRRVGISSRHLITVARHSGAMLSEPHVPVLRLPYPSSDCFTTAELSKHDAVINRPVHEVLGAINGIDDPDQVSIRNGIKDGWVGEG